MKMFECEECGALCRVIGLDDTGYKCSIDDFLDSQSDFEIGDGSAACKECDIWYTLIEGDNGEMEPMFATRSFQSPDPADQWKL